jgi:hypothetical protein
LPQPRALSHLVRPSMALEGRHTACYICTIADFKVARQWDRGRADAVQRLTGEADHTRPPLWAGFTVEAKQMGRSA